MFSIPIQSAIVNSIIGNAVLAGIFFYLWRADKRENALGYWAVAYAASACRVCFRLLGLEGYAEAIYGEALCGTVSVVLIWMGTRVFIGRPFEAPWMVGLAAAAGMGGVAGLGAVGVIPIVIPYLIAGGIYFLAGLALLRRGREHPGVGYSIIGFLFALYGGYAIAFSHLASSPQDPRSYIFGPIINLAMGMLMLVVTQRKQQFAADKLSDALLREAEGRRAAEDVGLQSEQRYRAIIDTTRSLIGLLTPDGTLIDINRAALERAGIRRQDVIGKSFWETPWWTHDAEQQRRLRQAIRRVAAGGHDRFESTHPSAGGSIGYFNFFLTPIRDADGQVIYLVPEAHDISARRRVEQTLHAAEQRFRAICEGSMLGVFVTDAAAQVTYFSRRATEITGITEAEAQAGRIAERIHPDDLEQHKRSWRSALVERKPFVSERRHLRRDGSLAWSRIHVAPILDGDALLGFVGTVEDINARKTTEQVLRESEERFSSFFALSPEPFAVASHPGGEYIQVNEAWERTFGFSQDEAVGRTGVDLGLWENPEDRNKMYEAIVRRGQARSGEIRLRRKNGDFIIVQISARVATVGQNKYILWGTHDVTERRRMEQALNESEEKFSKFFALGPEPMAVVRFEDAVYIDVNEAWLKKFGYSREEVVGSTPQELGFWEDFEERRRVIERLDRDGGIDGWEAWSRAKDGTRILSDMSARVFDLSGARYVLWDVHDITEKRNAEIQLRISEEKFSKAFHSNPDYMTISRLSDGAILDCNEAFVSFTGYARDEAINRSALDLGIWPYPEERVRFAAVLGQQGWLRDFECTLRGRDGREMACLLTASTIDMSGEQCTIAVARDVNAQRRMEQELRASEEKFSAIFHRSPVALGVTSIPEGRYIDVNEKWERQFHYTREQMIGRTSLDIGFWLDPGERTRLFADLGNDSQVQNREVHFLCGDGKEILCELSGQVFELNGRKVLLWGAHDVTEHRRAQREIGELNLRLEARVLERTSKLERAHAEIEDAMESLKLAQHELVRAEKLAALGSLVAGVAHELNTPIGNSVTVASTLHDKTEDFGQAVASGKLKRSTLEHYLEDARTASELLLRSLTQASDLISSFKQVAVDQASAQRRRFGLGQVVEEVAATLAPMLKKTPFKLELELAENVVMDSFPGSIGQVITNLVTNALAHAFENRDCGVMHIKTWRRGLHGVEMVFTDDGAGIPESDMKRVFDPFFTTKLGRGGSGLGLHIAYSLVTNVLGGRIQATSQPGLGTRFQISLPMKAPDRAEREA